MEAKESTARSWYKACARCGKSAFEDLLNEQGLCNYCRETVSMTGRAAVMSDWRKKRKINRGPSLS